MENEKATSEHEAENNGTYGFVQGLTNATQNMGTSIQGMQQQFLDNMQRAVQVTVTLNKMMEELVKRSIQIGVVAEALATEQPSTLLKINVTNRSPIPLVDMRVKLWFETLAGEDPVHLVMQQNEKGQLLFDDTEKETSPEQFTVSQLVTLGSSQLVAGAVRLELPRLVRLRGRIAVEFASPGSGSSLGVAKEFGVHLRHLLSHRFLNATEVGVEFPKAAGHYLEGTVRVGLLFIREAFGVSPAAGIPVGSAVLFNVEERPALLLCITHEDGSVAECQWAAIEEGGYTDELVVALTGEVAYKEAPPAEA